MKKIGAIILCIFWAAAGLWGCGSETEEEPFREYTQISLFCDVDFWTPPEWETSEGSITGKISRETGVTLDTTVPPQDADNQVRLMLANDNLTDLVCVTIGQHVLRRQIRLVRR